MALSDLKGLIGTGNYIRSAEMEYISLIMQEHLAHDCIEKLGEIGVVQFTDLNGDLTAFKRFYTPYIRRCDELEKKIKFFEEEMAKHGIDPEAYTSTEYSTWASNQRDTLSREHRGLSLLDYWESIINERHKDYNGIKVARDETAGRLYHAVQRRLVIEKAKDFFLEAAGDVSSSSGSRPVGGTSTRSAAGVGLGGDRDPERAGTTLNPMGRAAPVEENDMQFKHIAGIIATEDKFRFGRIIFRASAGHAVVRMADISEPLIDEFGVKQVKSVFAIFFRGRTLSGKLDRICSAFNAHQHDIPSFDNENDVLRALEETRGVMDDTMTWLKQETETSANTLRHLALLIRKWKTGVQREKAVSYTLNMFLRAPERGTVSAQAWVLKTAVSQVHETIQEAHSSAAQGGRMQPFYLEVLKGDNLPQPPTHFHTNKVTKVFQGIVNTYGIPRYGEANPALFSIMTFPFLFGVMYGDIGHATLLTLASGYLLWKEEAFSKGKLNEIFGMCFKGRYMLFMMGLFSIYCGFIYNDVFSLATSAFGGTRWHYPVYYTNSTNVNGTVIKAHMAVEAVKIEGYDDVYPFGVDPEWHAADNDLLFFNSLKMKMSVIFGITQMTFGLFLKLSNAIHYKSKADIWLEAVPQIIFMIALFGYMVFLILLKWVIDWNDPAVTTAPPSLIDTLINVALKPGTVPANEVMFGGQASLQVIILLIVFFTVPIMLCGKPLVFKYGKKAPAHEEDSPLIGSHDSIARKESVGAGAGLAVNGNGAHAAGTTTVTAAVGGGATPSAPPAADAGGHGHGESFGDVFVHQAIETIEFVLGSVSNTASYLRLWALSLAHSQLATVFWERALVMTIELDNPILVFVGYAVWAAITFAVLLVMDVLECFLHALRLHWVEFQNKFYKADGYKFTPFSFAALAEASDNAI